MKKTSKILSLILAMLIIASAMVACSPGEKKEDTNGDKKLKDTLTWAQSSDVFSFDPNIGKETTAIQVTGNIYDTLLTVDENMEVQPMLAESWEQEDEVTYLFKLRKGVKFHDGSDFTAEDAKYSLDRAVATPQVNYIAQFIDHVDIVDEYSIRLVTVEPYAPTLRNLTHPGVGITSKAYAAANGEEILKTAPMGTGPFKFVEWRQGDYVKLERFDEYWAGPAPMKNLIMRIIPESTQRTIAVETGEVDLAYDIVPNDRKRLEENDSTQVYSVASLMAFYVGINHTKPYMEDPLVREAIRLAIDPKPMIDSIMYGSATKAECVLPPAAFGFQKDLPEIKSDLEKAKELMADAGYPDGFKTSIIVSEDQTRVEICHVIQSQLKEIGIDCSIEVLEFANYVDSADKGLHDMCLQNWTTATADGDYTYYALFHTSKFGSQGNRVMKTIPGIDTLLDAAKASSDPDERVRLYGECEKLLTEYSVNRPLMFLELIAASTDKVEGFMMIPNTYHKLYKVKVYD